MKAILATILALLLIPASLGAGVHAADAGAAAELHVAAADAEESASIACCDMGDSGMSWACGMVADLAPGIAEFVPPGPARRAPRPAPARPALSADPDPRHGPPRTS